MTTAKDALQKIRLRAKNAAFFPPATDSKIDFANAMLKNEGAAPMPYDYAAFLKTTNGLAAPGIELYGTDGIDRHGRTYRFPNLAEANRELLADGNPLIKGCLLVGDAFLDSIIFDPAEGSYRVVSRLSFATLRRFANIGEVLEHLLGLL
ncbi:MAG: hypothetical protein LBI17_00460 [Rickettsiales bacterium]|jgi:hypothetical protein|nr:hypothetical protein [Rickettsiales bacterium]